MFGLVLQQDTMYALLKSTYSLSLQLRADCRLDMRIEEVPFRLLYYALPNVRTMNGLKSCRVLLLWRHSQALALTFHVQKHTPLSRFES